MGHPAGKPPDHGAAAKGKEGKKASDAPSPRAAIAPTAAQVRQRAGRARTHRPAGAAVASAQAAALTPAIEQKRAAAAQTVANLDEAKDKTKPTPRDAFKKKLKAAIEAATPKPKTKDEADDLMKNGAAQANAGMRGQLNTERAEATGPLQAQSDPKADVPPSAEPAPPQTPLQTEQTGAPPAPVSPAAVVPAPLPAEKLDYSADRAPTDQAMAESGVTQEQLAKGNEPQFNKALGERKSVEEHEAKAEGSYRQSEKKIETQAGVAATVALAKGIGTIHGARALHMGQVAGRQTGTMTNEARERQRITETINGIRDKTRGEVAGVLTSMESEAAAVFETGLAAAEKAYEDTFEDAKGGVGTWLTTWGDDWEELIENSLAKARVEYLNQVDVAIDQVATLIDGKLAEAKRSVAQGRAAVDVFVKGLDGSVRHLADEALESVGADFDAMGEEIDQHRDALVDKLADQYKASYERMAAAEDRLREENKSLWQRIYDATVGLIKKIIEFKNMLMNALARAASVIGDIISDPIGFLGNLISGVMQGLKNFIANIATHLKKGLLDWMFGALGNAGLKLPDTLDLKGIVSIVLQVLGLTYESFRARAVALLGPTVAGALEKAADIFQVVASQGVTGLWNFIKEKVEDLKSMVLDALMDFVQQRVFEAGITWIIGLLNPVSAFFKACKAIYEIVKFFIERAKQIIELINAIVDSIAAIAKGSIGVAAEKVEKALAKTIPVAIGFLASLLGLGDITGTIRKLIDKARAPINKAIDWVIGKAVMLAKAAGKAVKGLFKKKDKEEPEHKHDDPAKQAQVDAGLAALDAEEHAHESGEAIFLEDAEGVAQRVKKQHPVFKTLKVVDGKTRWDYLYVASPPAKRRGGKKKNTGVVVVTATGSKPPPAIYVSAEDKALPGPSTVGALPVQKPKDKTGKTTRLPTPDEFEWLAGYALEDETGLKQQIAVRKTKDGPKRGWTKLPEHYQEGVLLRDPKVGTERGNRRVPDFLLFKGGNIEVFEVTMDAAFELGRATDPPSTHSHKRRQFATNVLELSRRYPGHPIVYNIRVHEGVDETTRKELDTELRYLRRQMTGEGTPHNVQIIWRTGLSK